jgi:hypothetical protein
LDRLVFSQGSGVSERFVNVLGLEIGVIGEDFSRVSPAASNPNSLAT